MKKWFLALAFMVTTHANANLITISISDTEVAVGESVTVEITGSGFEDFDFLSFALAFDTSVLGFNPDSLSSPDFTVLDDTSPFPFGLLVTPFDSLVGSGLGFDLSADFFLGEVFNGDFTLATFTLDALAPGFSEFSVQELFATLGPADPFGGIGLLTVQPFNLFPTAPMMLDVAVSINARGVQVNPASVSEPAVWSLFAAAFALLQVRRFKARK